MGPCQRRFGAMMNGEPALAGAASRGRFWLAGLGTFFFLLESFGENFHFGPGPRGPPPWRLAIILLPVAVSRAGGRSVWAGGAHSFGRRVALVSGRYPDDRLPPPAKIRIWLGASAERSAVVPT